MACAAELTAALLQARIEARLPATIGQPALDRAVEALAALVEARRRIVGTHQALDGVRVQIGLNEVSGGDLVPKPAPGITEGADAVRIRAAA